MYHHNYIYISSWYVIMTIQTPACEQLIIEIGISAAILAHLLNYLLSADTLQSTLYRRLGQFV